MLILRHLPMTWYFQRVSPAESYTFRWGRGSGVITVHSGDLRGSHEDKCQVDSVRVGHDWIDDHDLRLHAARWIRVHGGRRQLAT